MTDPVKAETQQDHHLRRSRELNRLTKAALCAQYRRLGGMGGIHPPEKWRKDEVVTSVVEMEWDRLPAERKLPDPPRMSPPCDVDGCGKGENALAHHWGGDHNYVTTFNPDAVWVPVSEAEEARLAELAAAAAPDTEPQPATVPTFPFAAAPAGAPDEWCTGCNRDHDPDECGYRPAPADHGATEQRNA